MEATADDLKRTGDDRKLAGLIDLDAIHFSKSNLE
jgi:hypothetical protein